MQKSGNEYYFMRHGQSKSNVDEVLNGDVTVANPITEKGMAETDAALENIPKDTISNQSG